MTATKKLAKKDLSTFSESDLNTLFSYYKIPIALPQKQKINLLIHHLYFSEKSSKVYSKKKASLPEGTIWDAIKQDNYENFLEFVNDPSFDKNVIYNRFTLLTFILGANVEHKDKYIEKLIDKGVDVNKPDNYGNFPLPTAVIQNNIKYNLLTTIELLLKAGADPNTILKYTPRSVETYPIEYVLSSATVNSHASIYLQTILKLLLDYGAKITPNAVAIACNNFKVSQDTSLLDILIDYKLSDINLTGIPDDKCHNYILEKLKLKLDPYFEVFSNDEVEYLKSECDLNTVKGIYKCIDMAENMYEYHPLNENAEELGKKYKDHSYFQKKASFSGEPEKRSRASLGSEFKASLPEGTIWDAIARDNYENFLEFVNDSSFDKNSMFNGLTLLTFTLLNSEYMKHTDKYIEKLIEKGVDVNKPDKNGNFPLPTAVMQSNIKYNLLTTIELLLKAGADPNKKFKYYILFPNETYPIDYITSAAAVSPNKFEYLQTILKLLLDYGAKITPNVVETACTKFKEYQDTTLLDILIDAPKSGNLSSIDLPSINDNWGRPAVKCHNYILTKLKSRLDPYFDFFSPREVEYLKTECDLNTVKGIYKCLDMAENMYKYHPLNEKAEELGKKYQEHPYYQPKK